MQFLGDNWWLFLISFLTLGFLAFLNQIKRMKRLMSEGDFDITKGLPVLAAFALGAAASFILMVIGLIYKFTHSAA